VPGGDDQRDDGDDAEGQPRLPKTSAKDPIATKPAQIASAASRPGIEDQACQWWVAAVTTLEFAPALDPYVGAVARRA
jgi:hypothetical protein